MEIIKDLTNEAYRAMDGLSASDIKAILANPYKFKELNALLARRKI